MNPEPVLRSLALTMPLAAAAALITVLYLVRWLSSKDRGNDKMQKVSGAISKGADAYLKRQYKTVTFFFAAMFVILALASFYSKMSIFTPFAFVTGGVFSGLAGYVGMKTATSSNVRTAQAASRSLEEGLKVAFSSGSVMGLTVVGLALIHISLWYFTLDWYYTAILPSASQAAKFTQMASVLLTSSMGASSMALFARVGGGIFTKAADVGADLVGKVEKNIPEDDARNPAVIADNVGDNVGDVAGMGADLYESYVGSIIAASALGASAGYGLAGTILPFLIASFGVFASIIGGFFVRTGGKSGQAALLGALRRGTNSAALISTVGCFFIVRYLLGADGTRMFFALFSGLAAGVLIGHATEIYTSSSYKTTKDVSRSSLTGTATVIISGLSSGMRSTALPVLIISSAIMASYYIAGGRVEPTKGLFAVSLAAVGMLSTLGITLATDAYGPVADNAGGIAQMSGMSHYVRERTDELDSLGNTTAATGKGFAIGSAALTALALIANYNDQIKGFTLNLNLMTPETMSGVFVGAMLPFFFSAMTMDSVARAAGSIVNEVRRQFKEIPGIMEGTADPDYATCVDICTASAQKEMIMPSLLAIFAPIVTGIVLGPNGLGGMLVGSMVSGFLLAIMMSNAGGTWDNAKKYIEEGNFGGAGSDAHKAGIVGDTVGDPLKDTSGPSINILIKLMTMVAIVFTPVIVSLSLIK